MDFGGGPPSTRMASHTAAMLLSRVSCQSCKILQYSLIGMLPKDQSSP